MSREVRSQYMDVVKREQAGDGVYRVTIAANERVRQPPELDFDGLSTENYARNPVVMWAHDVSGRSPSGGLPIGRTLKLVKRRGGKLVVDFEFLDSDPFARRVRNAWDRGFLRAASISWLPVTREPMAGGPQRDSKSDLLEWSIVPVPADPDALRQAHRRMLAHAMERGGTPSFGSAGEAGGAPDAGDVPALQAEVRTMRAEIGRLVESLRPEDDVEGAPGANSNGAGSAPAPDDELIEIGEAVRKVLKAIGSKEDD